MARVLRWVWIVGICAFSTTTVAKAKNVILFIGDGMGQDIIDVAIMDREHNHPKDKPLTFEALFDSGHFAITHVNGMNAIADSASSATAMACGAQTLPEVLGIDRQGKACGTILEYAKSRGMRTGLVTDTRLTHATPAAFNAHVPHRSYENEIVPQLLDGDVDVLLGGGARHWLPKGSKFPDAMKAYGCVAEDYNVSGASKREDNMNYIQQAADKGYKIVCTRQQLEKLASKDGKPPKLLGLFSNSGHPYVNDIQFSGRVRAVPTVAEMTRAALAALGGGDSGFFLMVEGGQIDWALHDNDAGTALQELLELDEAIAAGIDFASKAGDTLILVTADHATGGLGLSYQKTRDAASLDGHVPAHVSEKRYVDLADFPELTGKDRYAADEDFLPYERLVTLRQQRKSFEHLIEPLAKQLDKGEITRAQAVAKLSDALKHYTDFTLTDVQLARVFRTEKDKQSHVFGADCPDYEQTADRFYVYRENNRRNVMGKLLSPQSGAVFSTGTHIHNPVLTFAYGPTSDVAAMKPVMSNADIYTLIKNAIMGN